MSVHRMTGSAIAAMALLLSASCSGDDDSPSQDLLPPAADLSGTWSVSEITTGNCQGSAYPEYDSYSATVAQTGNALAFTTPDGSFSGTISGSSVRWSASRPSGGGTLSLSFAGTVTGGNSLAGEATWTWRSTGTPYSCSGTTQVSATRTSSPAPSGALTLHAVAGNSQVSLTWNGVTGATSYRLYRASSPGVPTSAPIMEMISPQSTMRWTNRWLDNGTQYHYVVTAIGSGGESDPSPEVSAIPSAALPRPATPTNLSVTPGAGTVTVSFDAVAGATSYQVYRATASGQLSTYAALEGHLAATAYSHYAVTLTAGMTTGTTYYIAVTAGNVDGESDPTPEVSATPF